MKTSIDKILLYGDILSDIKTIDQNTEQIKWTFPSFRMNGPSKH
ncbi:MAG: hypothetical protein R2825_30570 [Saprospiraceae bacterium]